MKAVVGFIFTEGPIQDLSQRGFSFHRDESHLHQGYRAFVSPLKGANIEIREILDEQLYLRAFQNKHFEPFETTPEISWSPVENQNGIYELAGVLTQEHFEAGDLRTHFEIRKRFPLWAVWLRCRSLEEFSRIAGADSHFHWQERKVALIHLGPQCYDILVSP